MAKRKNAKVSNYTGVSWKVETQKWVSSVSDKGHKYDCGSYETEREAAKGRDLKILALGLKKPLQIFAPALNN